MTGSWSWPRQFVEQNAGWIASLGFSVAFGTKHLTLRKNNRSKSFTSLEEARQFLLDVEFQRIIDNDPPHQPAPDTPRFAPPSSQEPDDPFFCSSYEE